MRGVGGVSHPCLSHPRPAGFPPPVWGPRGCWVRGRSAGLLFVPPRLLLLLSGCTKSSSEGPGSPLKAAAGNLRCPGAMSLRSAARRSPWISGGCGSSPGQARAVGLALTALGFALGRYRALVLPHPPLFAPVLSSLCSLGRQGLNFSFLIFIMPLF